METLAIVELIEKLKAKNYGMRIYLNANSDLIGQYIDKQKTQVKNAATTGFLEAMMGSQHDPDCFGDAYLDENFTPSHVADSSTDAP